MVGVRASARGRVLLAALAAAVLGLGLAPAASASDSPAPEPLLGPATTPDGEPLGAAAGHLAGSPRTGAASARTTTASVPLDGSEDVPRQPVASVAPLGTPAPGRFTGAPTAMRAILAPTITTAGATGQSYELVVRTSSVARMLTSIALDLPTTMVLTYPRAGVRVDAGVRDLPVLRVVQTSVPRTVVGRRVRPAHRHLVITLRSAARLPVSSLLRVWVSRLRNPSTVGLLAIPVTLIGQRGAVVSSGLAQLRTTAPGYRCPTSRPAGTIATENTRRGSSIWTEAPGVGTTLAAYADRTSVACGDALRLRVDSSAPWITVWAWRMGGYAGRGARLVWRSGPVISTRRAAPVTTTTPNGLPGAIEARWPVTVTVPITGDWVPGAYLLQIRGSDGGRTFVPLVVRDRVGRARIGVVLSTNTWQVYNTWGGGSGYYGLDRTSATRSRVVSFDRPYGVRGDGQLTKQELPFIRWAEQAGYDVTYLSDDDLESGSGRLNSVQALVVPGHAEYWTGPMRAHVESMVVARGGNLLFLSANNVYWRARREPSPFGAGRRIAVYKNLADDPVQDPALITGLWRESPISSPEQLLLGGQYACLGADAPFVVPPSWPFGASGVAPGTVIPHLGWTEVDRVWSSYERRPDVLVLARSYAPCANPVAGQTAEWDIAAYRTPSGGAVVDVGTLGWTCHLRDACAWDLGDAAAQQLVSGATGALVSVFAAGPAGAAVAQIAPPWEMLPGP